MAPEPVLSRALLATLSLSPSGTDRFWGTCPFHSGSTNHDLMVDLRYGRFHCMVCGVTGWTEQGYRRWQERPTD